MLVAQLDRVSPSEGEGREFESRQARQKYRPKGRFFVVIEADESHAVSLVSEAKDADRRSRRDEKRQIFTISPSRLCDKKNNPEIIGADFYSKAFIKHLVKFRPILQRVVVELLRPSFPYVLFWIFLREAFLRPFPD